MGVAAGLLGGGGGGAVSGSGQILGPGKRAFAQTQAEARSRRFVHVPTSTDARFGRNIPFQEHQARQINVGIASRNRADPFSFRARRSELQAQFLGEDLQRASKNRDLLGFGTQRRRGGSSSSGGRASFLGSGSTPAGARSFTSLLRGF